MRSVFCAVALATLLSTLPPSAFAAWSGTSPPFYATSSTPSFPTFHYRCYLDRAGELDLDAVTIGFDAAPFASFGTVSAPDVFTYATFSGILTATYILGPDESYALGQTFSVSGDGGLQSAFCYTTFSRTLSPTNIASFAGTERFAIDVDFTPILAYGVTGPLVYPEFTVQPDITIHVTYDYSSVPEPASLGLLGLGALALRRRRWTSQREQVK